MSVNQLKKDGCKVTFDQDNDSIEFYNGKTLKLKIDKESDLPIWKLIIDDKYNQ